jgi:hypothetical protein
MPSRHSKGTAHDGKQNLFPSSQSTLPCICQTIQHTKSSGSRLAPVLRASLLACLSSELAVPEANRRGTAVVRRRGAARKAERAMRDDMVSAIGVL